MCNQGQPAVRVVQEAKWQGTGEPPATGRHRTDGAPTTVEAPRRQKKRARGFVVCGSGVNYQGVQNQGGLHLLQAFKQTATGHQRSRMVVQKQHGEAEQMVHCR